MTIEQALASIVDDGINLGAADFVDVEALKVAADVLRKVIAGRLVEPGHEWISVEERMPDLHDSIFVKGGIWVPGLPRMISDTVLAVVEYESGKRNVLALQTEDGEWPLQRYYKAKAVTHWMTLPEPPK